MASALPKNHTFLGDLRRALAARAVRGRKRLELESGMVNVIDTRPMRAPDGEVVHVPLTGNDFLRYLIAMVGTLPDREVVKMGIKNGMVRGAEQPRVVVAR